MPTRTSGSWWSLLLSLAALGCEPERAPLDPESATASPVCAGAEQMSRVWNPSVRDQLAAALEQLPGEWPQQLLASLDARMPAHAQHWTDSYEQACARQANAALRCLDRRAWQLDATLGLIVDDPERTAALWAALERGVDDPRACMDESGDAPPELEWARGRELASLPLLLELNEIAIVEPIVAELERDSVLSSAPRYALQVALARAAVEQAGGRREGALAAITLAVTYAEALDPGARSAVADASAKLAHARGDRAATELARAQAVAHAREQADAWLLVTQLAEQGRSWIEHGEPARAVPLLAEAISIAGRLGGADNPATAELQTILAQAQLELGQIEPAHDALTQARDAFVIALGPDHPQTLATVEAVGRLFVAAGQLGDAQFAFLDLLEIYGDLYGLDHWRTARIKLELADSLMAMDQHDSARTLYTEALTPLARELGPVHPDVVRTSIHLGIAELALGNFEAAEPHCRRGRDLATALAPNDPLADEAEQCLARIAKEIAKATAKPSKKNR
ncbi:MAG TPA: tetratricopeptide repeat protein [Enhygromyxa sp.]|nr:tetratricopeptide repeat protein [Enhygromyxa sp.]